MITANLFHIKSTNGLFYYGLDYLRESSELVRAVLVRPELAAAAREQLPGKEVIACTLARYLAEIGMAVRHGDLIFTPSSHPLPGLSRQWIVMHDAYPFETGRLSALKRWLLRLSLASSSCKTGYINRSDAKPFLASLGVAGDRLVFAPNKFPPPPGPGSARDRRDAQATILVGLLGTDSPKKNYELLFAAVRQQGTDSQLKFRVYGHDTPYLREILATFPEIDIELVRSDLTSLTAFMSSVDLLASAAEKEGFGRPIATALLMGLPVYLLDRPVFREFFSRGAVFHPDVNRLAQALVQSPHTRPEGYAAPGEVVQAYVQANSLIRQLCALPA